eukprot:4516725-Alexandrium_andersonii.AAC.1
MVGKPPRAATGKWYCTSPARAAPAAPPGPPRTKTSARASNLWASAMAQMSATAAREATSTTRARSG